MADLSKLSDDDLIALKSGDLSKVSDAGLLALKGSSPVQEFNKQPMAWSDVASGAAKNFLPSLGNLASGIYQTVRHPLDTAQSVADLAAGGLQNTVRAISPGAADFVNRIAPSEANQRTADTANAVGKFYKDRYGSVEGFKNAVATDPAGVMADVSTVLTGAAALAPKAGAAQRMLSTVARNIDPVSLTLRGVGKAADVVSATGIPSAVLGATTGAGQESVRQAFRAGKEGGSKSAAFADNMRGNVPIDDVLTAAKQDLEAIAAKKRADYRSGMVDIRNDKAVLGFGGIDTAIRDAVGKVTFKGQVKNERAASAVQKMADEVAAWKKLDPAEFHTPEGLDALKQKLGAILEDIPYEQKTARLAAGEIYNAVRGEITKQAPTYAKVMADYAKSSDLISEIERSLFGGNKAAADTSLRKLQSVMRNNVQTNYGQRVTLAKTLEDAGGLPIMPQLAGQAMNSWMPRGLQTATTGGGGAVLVSQGMVPSALGLAAASSPRLVGELTHAAGQATGLLSRGATKARGLLDAAGVDPRVAALLAYQAGQPLTISGSPQ